jgi:predicted GIY-YIG superfamily endonuclease
LLGVIVREGGRSSIPEAVDGSTKLLRLHTRQSHRRHTLHWTWFERLVYFEQFHDAENAIKREKRLKRWNRAWKIRLIEEHNPNWDDLYLSIAGA